MGVSIENNAMAIAPLENGLERLESQLERGHERLENILIEFLRQQNGVEG